MEETSENEGFSVNYAWCILAGIMISIFVKSFIIDVFRVSGKSMEGTFSDGQIILVNKLAYGIVNPFGSSLLIQWKKPAENDVIIYLYQDSYVIKRCAAAAGMTMDFLEDSGYSLRMGNGRQISLTSIQYHRMKNCHEVPQGYVFALGDNLSQSFDSRNYGFVPEKNILGKAICRRPVFLPDGA